MTPLNGALLVAVCLISQGFFSGSEMALVSSNRAVLKARADGGSTGAALALQMLEHEEDRLIGTCLIGTNVSLIAGTTIAGVALATAGHGEEWLLTALYVPLGLVFGEALPKLLYRHYADILAPRLAPILRGMQLGLTPALWVVSRWSALLKRLLPMESEPIRRQDIVRLLDDRADHSIDPTERAFIRRLLSMNALTAAEAMTPLVDVKAIPDSATVAEAIEVVLQEGHSRIPVYRERVDNLVGRVEHKDLLFTSVDTQRIGDLIRPIRFVPDSKKADELLREMRENSDPFAAVVDEYGGSVGIVTMEDLFEHVVGDIEDERDAQVPGIRRLGDHEWRVPARTEVEDLEAAIGRPVPRGEYETVAGLLLATTGKIPQSGAVIRAGELTFHVEVASERAVHTVRVVTSGGDPPTAGG